MKWAKPVVNLATPVLFPILVKLHALTVLPVNTTAVECAKFAKVANIKINRAKAVANPIVMSVTTLTVIKRIVYRVVRGNTKMKTTKQAVAKQIVPPVITLKAIKRRVCLVVRVNTKTKAINRVVNLIAVLDLSSVLPKQHVQNAALVNTKINVTKRVALIVAQENTTMSWVRVQLPCVKIVEVALIPPKQGKQQVPRALIVDAIHFLRLVVMFVNIVR